MKRVAMLMLTAVVLAVGSTPAFAAIKIRKINFDPAGSDTGSNWHLNREFIHLVNTGPRPKQLRGWTIADRGRDHIYRFGSLYLEPGDTVRLHTGRGYDGAPGCEEGTPCPEHAHYDFHWGLDHYVWDNDGDRAILKNAGGTVVDRCAYTGSADSPARC